MTRFRTLWMLKSAGTLKKKKRDLGIHDALQAFVDVEICRHRAQLLAELEQRRLYTRICIYVAYIRVYTPSLSSVALSTPQKAVP